MLLKLENISLSFPEKKLFENFHLDLEEASFCHLSAQSGQGKTLLLRSLLGIAPKGLRRDGDVFWNGKKISSLHPYCRKEVAYLPQLTSSLNPLMKTKDLFQKLSILRGIQLKRQIDLKNYLKEFSLNEDILNSYPKELSGGMAKRVLLALSLLGFREGHFPLKLLLADEITLGLDEELSIKIFHLMEDLVQEKKLTILLVGHENDMENMMKKPQILRRIFL